MKTVTACHEKHDVSACFGPRFVMKSMTSLIYHIPSGIFSGSCHAR